ncbi:MAG: methylmalonyl Co-A mutase-associated GTPase MeaB [Pseudomonadota bacterium]
MHDLAARLLAGERRALARAITLIESSRSDDREMACRLLDSLLPQSSRSLRIGISGVPGAGKSTFIEALGLLLVAKGHRLAVLAIDPSSAISGGSILADKTRMEQLAASERAFIRPSPSGGLLGGVALDTREVILLCEAAGHDVVIVETVGIGQSETAVADMTDVFVLLQLPNAGDELQAIKRGVLEFADLVLINKCDLDPTAAAAAQAHVSGALRRRQISAADPGVLCVSALRGTGVAEFWAQARECERLWRTNGEFDRRRARQARAWMWSSLEAQLLVDVKRDPGVAAVLATLVDDVDAGRIAPSSAALRLLREFRSGAITRREADR